MISLYLNLSAASVISGDYFGKSWSVSHKPMFLILSFVGYFFSAFFYTPTLLRRGLVYTALIWNLIGVIGFLIIGWVIFKESTSAIQIVGVVFGLTSLVILMATG